MNPWLWAAPLSLDTLAACLGLASIDPRRALRAGAVLVAAEALAPAFGLIAGARLAGVLPWRHVAGSGLLVLAGLWILLAGSAEAGEARSLAGRGGIRLGLLAAAVSADEFAAGLGGAALGLPVGRALLLSGLQSLVAGAAGIGLGRRLGRWGPWPARVAGGWLLVLGVAGWLHGAPGG